ncbi:MAG TPA: 50S ribosomal protein L23 [Anaerolineae bacterium]|jgi:large subunit ribosomal protein L23|nr:50S ribosomal protein L23 [Anaerolineae bacterium]
MHVYEIVKRPIITEKSQEMADLYGHYTFEVDRRANKALVKAAVEKVFNVAVVSVNIMTVPPKRGRYGNRVVVKKPQWKKAVVTLAPGETISIFEGA